MNPSVTDLSTVIALARAQGGEAAWRRVLALDPDNPHALNALGNLLAADRPAEAERCYRRLLLRLPNLGPLHFNLANVLRAQGRLEEAVAAYRKAVALGGGDATTLNNLATTLRALNRLGEAEGLLRQAVASEPAYDVAWTNLGRLLADRGRKTEAEGCYRRALALAPDQAEALNNLGNLLFDRESFDEAEPLLRRALALRPDFVQAAYNLGNLERERERLDEALALYDRALSLDPNYAEAHNNRADILLRQGQLEEAHAGFSRALALRPDWPDALNNLGIAWQEMGDLDQAMACFDRALALDPTHAVGHFSRGLCLLVQGQLAEGWPEYEWRWRIPNFLATDRVFAEPRWRGEELAGRRLLLYAEQGFGDGLHFLRYAPLAAARGGRVVVEVPPALKRLAASLDGVEAVIAQGEPLPPFDLQAPLISLPLIFGTTLATIPAQAPYLAAPPEAADRWRARLQNVPRPRVGLVWAGSPTHKNDHNRSLSLERLAPVLAQAGINWVSLQKGPAAAQLAGLPAGTEVLDLGSELEDFADTAAVVAQLDLVISVDTSVVHLAGALGRPVWVLLPFAPDWRWMREREDSPWYPGLRLFRQPRRGDWAGPVARLAAALKDWVAQRP